MSTPEPEQRAVKQCVTSESESPRPLSRYLPDRRDLRDVQCRRWDRQGSSSRLPSGGDQSRVRLLRALHSLYRDYRAACSASSSARGHRRQSRANKRSSVVGTSDDVDSAVSENRPEESREFDALSMGGGPGQPDNVSGRLVVMQRRRQSSMVNQVFLRQSAGVEVWIDVPLALELRLPRVQEMLRHVMSECPFLTDRTEALGELRASGYEPSECVEYLREVRDLRDAAANTAKGENRSAGDALQTDSMATAIPTASVAMETNRRLIDGLAVLRASVAECSAGVAAIARRFGAEAAGAAAQAEALSRSCRRLRWDARGVRARRLEREVAELRARCRDEERQRRAAFNDLQEQLGSVRVFARCRRGPGEQALTICGPDGLRVISSGGGGRDETFYFDGVFAAFGNTVRGGCGGAGGALQRRTHAVSGASRPSSRAPAVEAAAADPNASDAATDARMFDELQPLIASFLDGFNVCFIAYGGEASGKTYALHGPTGEARCGLVYRSMTAALADAQERAAAAAWRLELTTACLEIYNDALLDLGDPASRGGPPRRLPASCLDGGLETLFDSLSQAEVTCEMDILEAIRLAAGRRRVARTALNPRSSRSHLVHLMRVRGLSATHGERVCSFLGLMDLAGAENVVKAATADDPQRSAEAGHINRSLTSFNRLFLNLRRCSEARGVPSYRDSRLTQLMKPFVTDHGKCCIIVTVRTDRQSLGASLSTLRFGRDARQVMLGRARRHVV